MLFVALTGVGYAACTGTDTVAPGFEEVGGGGGAGGDGGKTATSSSKSSVSAGPSSSAHSSSAGPGSATGTGGAPCLDTGPGEPNDTESTALALDPIDDCDGSGSSLKGVLSGADDIDWYKYAGDDTFGCEVSPKRTLTTMDSLRLCKYVQCDGGPATVTCLGGSVPKTSPDGRPGCCGTQGFDLGLDCPGTDDNATVYISLDQPQPVCVAYELGWNY